MTDLQVYDAIFVPVDPSTNLRMQPAFTADFAAHPQRALSWIDSALAYKRYKDAAESLVLNGIMTDYEIREALFRVITGQAKR
jgi:hypothetical protein